MNAADIKSRNESWSQFFENWILELALSGAVFAAVVHSVASLSGF